MRDSLYDNRVNDLFWFITLRGTKVLDAFYRWGYIGSSQCAVCGRRETIDHCFLNRPRAKRVWAHFCPLLSAVTGSRFLVNLLTIFFFAFQCDAKKSVITRFIIKNIAYSIWTFRNKSTFYNGREDASALIKYALHSIKGRVKLDFHHLPRGKFVRTWVDPGFCIIRNDILVFCF